MEFTNPSQVIEKAKEIIELIALKKALIKKGVISDGEIKAEKK